MHATHQKLGENLQRPSFTPTESSDRYIPRDGNIEASSEHGTDRETTGNKDGFDLPTKEEPSTPYTQQKAAFACEVQGFLDLQQHLKSFSQDGTRDWHRMDVKGAWEVPQAMRLYSNKNQFAPIFTITGNEVYVQAESCEEDLKEHFQTGPMLLHAVQA